MSNISLQGEQPTGHMQWSRTGRLLLFLGFLVALAPIIIILIQLDSKLGLKDVTAYSSPVYQPERSEVCPGDMLVFTPTLNLSRAPIIVEVSSSWWDVVAGRTAVSGKKGDVSISIFRKNENVERRLEVLVPPLLPGRYEYLRATESSTGSRTSVTSVPFVVPNGCDWP